MQTFVLFILCASAARATQIPAKNTRIINGSPATKGQFPWQVAIDTVTPKGPAACGGSLVTSTWVLTAAHCVENPISVSVYLGIAKLNDPEIIIIKASRVVPHPNYLGSLGNNLVLLNDVALVRLSKPVEYTDFVQPIKLAWTPLGDGVKVTVSGWGKTSDTSGLSPILNYVDLVTMSNDDCAYYYGALMLAGGYLCAQGHTTENFCSGDSGGPLITGFGKDALLVGIVSFGNIQCTKGDPAGFTRTAPYKNWIISVVGDI